MGSWGTVFLLVAALALPAVAAETVAIPTPSEIRIARAAGAIEIDGMLDDPAWSGATRITTWYETNPGDNVEPPVGNEGYVAYDDRFLYAGFRFADPDIEALRAPWSDRDDLAGSTDYGGIIVDTQDQGKRAILFLANPRGIQYDAITDDSSGEDASPDWFWDAAARVGDDGWSLEIRVPFSSLRYARVDPQTWRIMLYRNYPRDHRYQFFTTRLPRGGNCFVCRSNPLVGLESLPPGGRWVLAPYATGMRHDAASAGLGAGLEAGDADGDVGLDAKWTPNENTALDATLNPDFSQVESDVAQIGVNERFALFFPEKRPFFLEGSELFSTPFRAVYTRTVTSPRWGARATGRVGPTSYTVLAAEDRGGGSVILPGPNGSSLAPQDFRSDVFVGRVRRDLGRSFFGLLATGREVDGGGHNRVLGPDFEWRPNDRNQVTGQVLFSRSETPDRPELAAEWDGRRLDDHAAQVWWSRNTPRHDLFLLYRDVGDDFRADNGFVPQVGYREAIGETGYTVRPTGFFRRVRTFLFTTAQDDRQGDPLLRRVVPGVGMDARWSSFLRFELQLDEVRAGDELIERDRLAWTLQANPGRVLNQIGANGTIGEAIDFANARPGDGGTLNVFATVRPIDRLAVRLDGSRQWLDVDAGAAGAGRLFTAHVGRARLQYTFTARAFFRVIGQWVDTERVPARYTFEVAPRERAFDGSALFAYKLNWQSVLFAGWGDARALGEEGSLEPAERLFFVKLSYAFQG